MVFVFPSLPTSWRGGSTGTVLDFEPRSGALSALIGGEERRQEYVDAGLFCLIGDVEEHWAPDIDLTYAAATEALRKLIAVDRVAPKVAGDGE